MQVLLIIIGSVFYFLHILILGYVLVYNPISYSELVEGLGRTETLFIITIVNVAEYAVASIVMAVLIFPFLILLARPKIRFSGSWLVIGLVLVWLYFSGQSLAIAAEGRNVFVIIGHLLQSLVAGSILLIAWLFAGHLRARLTRQPSPTR